MLRRKLRLRKDDLKELMVKPVPTWCTNRKSHGKGKAKQNQNNNKSKQTTTFKKKKKNKKDDGCFVRGSPDHWAKKYPNCKGRKPQHVQKTTNMIVFSSRGGTSGCDNLPYILSVFQSITWWLDSGTNVHVCSNAFLFSSYQVARDSSVMMENWSHTTVHSVGMVDLKLTSKKIVQLKNVQHVRFINKNLLSGSILYRDGFKIVLESNKFAMLKCGHFFGKGYVCEGFSTF
jgi:hypothetical protein